MSNSWHSLYLPASETATAIAALIETLQSLGYQRYDPFPGGTGTPPETQDFCQIFRRAGTGRMGTHSWTTRT